MESKRFLESNCDELFNKELKREEETASHDERRATVHIPHVAPNNVPYKDDETIVRELIEEKYKSKLA